MSIFGTFRPCAVPYAQGRRADPSEDSQRPADVAPASPDAVAALRQLRDAQGAAYGFEHARTGYLAVDEAGQALRPERWSDMWAAHLRNAGIRPLTLQSARHSSVTAMRALGVPDHVVAEWHGHDEVVMRRSYSHADEDSLRAAGQALSGVLGGAL